MGEAREFLMDLIRKDNISEHRDRLTLCYKIIMRMGLIRANPEDFLIVNDLLTTHP
jgi:hypothetical protein